MLMSIAGLVDIDDSAIRGKRVLMRVDYFVSVYNGVVGDEKLRATLPTINMLFDRGAKSIVLLSHFGGECENLKANYSLRIVAPVLMNLLGERQVYFFDQCCGPRVEHMCASLPDGSVALLENVGFNREETGVAISNPNRVTATKTEIEIYRASLSKLGEIFVNDAFSMVYRDHSSVVGISTPIRVAGLLLKKELVHLSCILEATERPVLVILGAQNLKNRVPLIMNLLDKVDMMIISGALAFTFLKVTRGVSLGISFFDEEGAKCVPAIMEKAKRNNVSLHFPQDFLCTRQGQFVYFSLDEGGIPPGWNGIEIGPQSVARFEAVIAEAKAIMWRGGHGFMRRGRIHEGSLQMLDAMVNATRNGCTTVVVGGKWPTFLKKEVRPN